MSLIHGKKKTSELSVKLKYREVGNLKADKLQNVYEIKIESFELKEMKANLLNLV